MRVTPITPVYPPKNPPQRHRALMAVRFDEHTVIDVETGQRFTLPAKEAWALHQKLNGGGNDK